MQCQSKRHYHKVYFLKIQKSSNNIVVLNEDMLAVHDMDTDAIEKIYQKKNN